MLKKQCPGKANNYGKTSLERLRRGLFPSSHKTWPVQEAKVAEEGKFKVRTKLIENKKKKADIPVEQDAAGSSNDHVNQEDNVANELPQGLDEGEEFEQAMMWQGLDESDSY